jgi:hypothetical protein
MKKGPFAVTIAYLKSIIVILESLEENNEDDNMNVNIGILNDLGDNIKKLVGNLQRMRN